MRRASIAGAAALVLMGGCRQEIAVNATAANTSVANVAAPVPGPVTPPVGPQNIVAGLAPTDSRFADAVKAAGLVPALAGSGPYTVLIPDDGAFSKLPPGALDPSTDTGKARLVRLIAGHVLPGTMLASDIGKAVDRDGKAELATMSGALVTFTRRGQALVVSDRAGHHALVTGVNGKRTNGIVFHIDTVLAPRR